MVHFGVGQRNTDVGLLFLQRIQYARKDSDVIAKMKGTFVERPKKKPQEDEHYGKKKKKGAAAAAAAAVPQKYHMSFIYFLSLKDDMQRFFYQID